MTNRLLQKIHQKNIQAGVDFDEAFTGSKPSSYGIYGLPTSGGSIVNNNGGLTSIAKGGPLPNQYCWNFKGETATGKSSRLYWSQSGGGEMPIGLNVIKTMNYTYSMWIKINHDINLNPNYNRSMSQFNNDGYNTSNDTWYSGWWIGYVRQNNSANPYYLGLGINFYTMGHDKYFFADADGNQIVKDKWYLVSVRKTYSGSGNVDIQYLINGKVVYTATQPFIGSVDTTGYSLGYGQSNYYGDFSVGPIFFSTAADLSVSDILDIYNYGLKTTAPFKHWDGSAWVDSIDHKVYNGTNWIDTYASVWDGTSWIKV